MDLRAIRSDLAVVAQVCQLNAWDYPPDDVQVMPAAVVGSPQAMRRLNRLKTEVQIPVTFYVNNADSKDATSRLDLLLSTGMDGSYLEALDSVKQADAPAWDSVRFVSAEGYQLVTMPGETTALACRIVLELTA